MGSDVGTSGSEAFMEEEEEEGGKGRPERRHPWAAMILLMSKVTEDIRNATKMWDWKRVEHDKIPTLPPLKLQDNADLADPWDLPPYFIMRIPVEKNFIMRKKESSTRLLTQSGGYWKEKNDRFTAILSQGQQGPSSSSSSPSYQYQGVKRTLEFYEQDDTKTDWLIHEYLLLDADKNNPDALFLQEDVVVRKVFQKNIDQVPTHLRELDSLLSSYAEEYSGGGWARYFSKSNLGRAPSILSELSKELRKLLGQLDRQRGESPSSGSGECSTTSAPESGGESEDLQEAEASSISAARDEKSNVWQHFTKIYTRDPGVVYALCHSCDSVLHGHPKNGTSSLTRHCQTCSSSTHRNPPSTTDQEILHQLRTEVDLYKQDKMEINDNLANAVSNEYFRELERMWNKDECYNDVREEEVQRCMSDLSRDCFLIDQSQPGKRKRTRISKIWQYFIRILTKDPNRVYAVCNCCDRGYKGHSKKNGTSTLWKHNKTCSTKQQELPRQNQVGSVNGVDAIWEAEVWAFAVLQQLCRNRGTDSQICTEAGNNEDDVAGCYISLRR